MTVAMKMSAALTAITRNNVSPDSISCPSLPEFLRNEFLRRVDKGALIEVNATFDITSNCCADVKRESGRQLSAPPEGLNEV